MTSMGQLPKKPRKDLFILLATYALSGCLFVLWVALRPNNVIWGWFVWSVIVINACAFAWMAIFVRFESAYHLAFAAISSTAWMLAVWQGAGMAKPSLLATFAVIALANLAWMGTRGVERLTISIRTPEKLNRGIKRGLYWLFMVGCAAFFSVYIFAIVSKANWVLGDDHQLLTTILSGKAWNITMNWPVGRFNPLYYVEYDPFVYIGNKPFLFFLWVAFKAICTGVLLYLILRYATREALEYGIHNKSLTPSVTKALAVGFVVVFFLSKNMYQMFAATVFPEQTLIPFLALFLVGYVHFLRNGGITAATVSLVAANLACYLKEPTFAVFAVVAVVGLIQWKRLTVRQRGYHVILLMSALAFLALYYFLVFRHTTSFYSQGRAMGKGYLAIAWNIATVHPIIPVSLVVFLVRLKTILREKKLTFYDTLIVAALAFVGSFIVLRLDTDYYSTPVYVLILPSLFYFVLSTANGEGASGRLQAGVLGVLITVSLIGTGRLLANEMQLFRRLRVNDIQYVRGLEAKNLYFYTVKETDPNRTFQNDLDDWTHYTLQVFVDFDLNGKYTGEKKIIRVNDPTQADLKDSQMVLLIPTRLRGRVQLPTELKLASSYWLLDSYVPRESRDRAGS